VTNFLSQFGSRRKVCRLSAPTLFISGLSDSLVPPKMMSDLFDACGAPSKRLAKFAGGTHNETWSCRQYYPALDFFLREVANVIPSSSCESPSSLSLSPGVYSETGAGTVI